MISSLKNPTGLDADTRRALVVVGMHRSGTSAITRTLSLLGAALPRHIMPPAENNNEMGFWESQPVADLNDDILETLDSEWDDVFAIRPRQYLSNFDTYHMGKAVQTIEEEFRGSELIVLKDPRISILASFWERVLRRAGYSSHYIIMVRNPIEVAESLRARNSFPLEKSLLLWNSYMVAVDRDTRGLSRSFVCYDQLLGDWRAVRARLENNLGFPFPRDTSAASIAIDRYLQHGMHHHIAASTDIYGSDYIPCQTKALYRIYMDACEGIAVDERTIDQIEAEMLQVDALMGPVLSDLKARARSLASEVDVHRDAGAKAAVEYQRTTDQLRTLLSAAESDRVRLMAELEEQRRSGAQLNDQLSAVAAERDVVRVEAEQQCAENASQLAVERSENERLAREAEKRSKRQAVALAELQNENSVLAKGLEEQNKKVTETTTHLSVANSRLVELDGKLAQLASQLKLEQAATAKLNSQIQILTIRKSETAARIDRLIELLANQESAAKVSSERAEWLRQVAAILIADTNSRKGRLYKLLPAVFIFRRQLKLLKRKGLFDSAAYLATNPDVAGSGLSPIRHYLMHGIGEGRGKGG